MENLIKPLQGITIIGVDPSLTNTGLVLISDGRVTHYANIKTTPQCPYSDRIIRIALDMNSFCFSLKGIKIDAIAIETPYVGGFKGNSFLKVAEARGALIGGMASYYRIGIPPIINITPSEAKISVGIDKRLKRKESKQAVKDSILKLFPNLPTNNQDILDAIAIAIAGAKKFKTEQALNYFTK